MHSICKYAFWTLVTLYFMVTFVINRSPHLRIKYIGFFSLGGITIETGEKTIRIKKVLLRMNLFRGKDSPLKLFNLELFDVEFHVKSVEKEKPIDTSVFDIKKLLRFPLSKRVYDLVFYYQVLNQFYIVIHRCTVYHERLEKDTKLHIDYARLENSLRYDGYNCLTLMLLNGFLHGSEDHDKVKIFRNVELILSCDVIFDCEVGNKLGMNASLTNFALSLSLGKTVIPLDHIHIRKSPKTAKTECHPISKERIDFLRQVWGVIKEVKLSMEDFTLSLGPCVLEVPTAQASVQHHIVSEAIFNIHITALKFFEAETKCFELPAAACALEGNPFGLLEGVENSHHEHLIDTLRETLDIKFNLTVTAPTFDIYHDQFIWLQIRNRTKRQNSLLGKVNLMNFMAALKNVSIKIVVVDAKFVAHTPPFGLEEFHRDANLNITTTHRIDSVVLRFANKELGKSLLAGGEYRKQLYGLFKIKNLKTDLLENTINMSKLNILFMYNIHNKNFSVKFNCKRIRFKSINSAIFQLVKEIRTRIIQVDNNLYYQLKGSPGQEKDECSMNLKLERETDTSKYLALFQVLPSVINRLKIEVNEVQADIICKDGLPLQIYRDPETGEEFDLKDYRRGVSLKLGRAFLNYEKDSEDVHMKLSDLQCFTLSEFDLDYSIDFDILAAYSNVKDDISDISSLESIALATVEDDYLRKIKEVFDIGEIEINNSSNRQRDRNRLSVRIPEVNGRVDIFLAWCTVYAASMMKLFKPTIERVCSKQEIQSLRGREQKTLKLDLYINTVAIVTRLPHKVDVLVEFDTLIVKDIFESKSCEFKYFRSYIVHPITKLWARFLTIKDSFVAINAILEDKHAFEVVCKGIRLNIPHGFLFYTVIDNIVTFGKAIKQITHNFNNMANGIDDFSALPQEGRSAFNFPSVNVRTSVFGVTLENDPFENELSYIFELGAIEQKIRVKKMQLFDAKAKEIKENTIDLKIKLHRNEPQKTTNFANVTKRDNLNGTIQNNIDGEMSKAENSGGELLSEEEAREKVENARELLESEFSASWFHKFKRFRKSKVQNWMSRVERGWGVEKISDKITDRFDIMNYLPGPLLMGLIFRDFDLKLSKTTVPDLDKFLHDYGKGQPKLDYSILVPFHISLQSSAVFAFLKDYSLPLLSFPSNDDPTKPSFTLQGNVVINEKLVHRKEEMRQIWVPFSPPMAQEKGKDSFYSVFVTRTLTPVKFMLDLNCKIDSQRAAMISWCKSYQAALLTGMSAVDNFTKPQIDDSPLGWWDKVPLIMHGQMSFDIPNELCFHMKSSTSPYEMSGRNAGFVFCWKNNVQLKIDGMHSSKQLITLTSDDFLLAIPNYSVAEKRSWSLFYDEMNDAVPDIESESKKYQKKVMRLSSDEKVQWTLGLLFERNKSNSNNLSDHEERTDSFVPHYDVVVTSPYFDWHPDSYEGYRSDYIHLAISVKSVSAKGNASNNVHFTPLTFDYFFFWWDTLTEAISLPIRQGPLFEDRSQTLPASSKSKTSTHLFTVKYQLILEPLTISHMQLLSSGEKNNRVGFTGLKARTKKCVIDLHQRKELLTYVNKKLGIENQIMHLKMNEAEISFDDADVRIVDAVFPDKSMQSQLDKYLFGGDTSSGETGLSSGSSSDMKSGSKYMNWMSNIETHGGDLSWMDQEDFTELEMREILSPYPQVTILPFFYTPRFIYVREFSLQENGPYPFGNESSHDCELESESPEDTQGKLLGNRLNNLNAEIEANENLLASIRDNDLDKDVQDHLKTVRTNIEECKDKKKLLEVVYEDVTGHSFDGEESTPDEPDDSNSLSISKLNSRLLSIYSSHKSYTESLKAGLLNNEVSEFHNRFIVHNLQLKWDNRVRDYFMNYIQNLSDKKSESYFLSKKAVDLVESVIHGVPESFGYTDNNGTEFSSNSCACEDVINGFDNYLDEVDEETQEAEYKFLVKLINPQIQLMSEKDPDATALVVSKDLELRIVSVNLKGMSRLINADNEISGTIETRYGGLFNDSGVFVFNKKDVVISHPDVPYGYVDSQLAVSWPPWVECENIFEDYWLRNNMIAERTSMVLSFKKPNYLYMDGKSSHSNNEIEVHVAKFVINADSQQYSTLYYLITDLLIWGKSQKNQLSNKLDKVMSLADNDDFYGLDERVKTLQSSIRELHDILLKIDVKSIQLNESEQAEFNQVQLELERRKLELSVIMRGLRLRNTKKSSKRASVKWFISIDQIIWHFLDAERAPLIDLALAKSRFYRADNVDGSNKNKVEIGIVQGFNLQKDVVYPDLLSPICDEKDGEPKDIDRCPMIIMSWNMLNPVGGIPIMQQAKLKIQPLKIQLDYHTSKILFDYTFPKDKDKDKSKSSKSSRKEPENDEQPLEQSEGHSNANSLRHLGKRDSSFDLSSFDISLEKPKNLFRNFNKRSNTPSLNTEEEDNDNSSMSSRKTDSISVRFSSNEDLSSPHTETSAASRPHTKESKKKHRHQSTEGSDDISLIVSRSSKYFSIVDIEVEQFKLFISFKAPKHLNIIDVHQLLLNIPNIRYQNKTWSGEDFILRLRKDITRIILQHTGQIIGNKFKVRKRKLLKEPLKQISNYASFLSVQDLQHGSEDRTSDQTRSHLNHHTNHRTHNRSRLHHQSSASSQEESVDDLTSPTGVVSFENLLKEIIDEEDEEDEQRDDKETSP